MTEGGRDTISSTSELGRQIAEEKPTVISNDAEEDEDYLDNPSYANSYLNVEEANKVGANLKMDMPVFDGNDPQN